MKNCELCKSEARIYCDSDQASLCWSCDARVHSANFLVARHSRCILCHVCRSPTPWCASGEKLGRTVSICERCVHGVKDGSGGAEEEIAGGKYDEENQIVPKPPPASCSSKEVCSSSLFNGGEEVSSKRIKRTFVCPDLNSDYDDCYSPALDFLTTGDGGREFSGSFSSRPLKIRKVNLQPAISRLPATVDSFAGEDGVRK